MKQHTGQVLRVDCVGSFLRLARGACSCRTEPVNQDLLDTGIVPLYPFFAFVHFAQLWGERILMLGGMGIEFSVVPFCLYSQAQEVATENLSRQGAPCNCFMTCLGASSCDL